MQSEAIRDEVLKMDRLGRVRVSSQRREALLDAFENCGVSAMVFAAHVGVNYQTFATWRQKRERLRQAQATPSAGLAISAALPLAGMQWLEAVIESPAAGSDDKPGVPAASAGAGGAGSALRVVLPGGARMEIADAAHAKLAAVLLRALEAGGSAAC